MPRFTAATLPADDAGPWLAPATVRTKHDARRRQHRLRTRFPPRRNGPDRADPAAARALCPGTAAPPRQPARRTEESTGTSPPQTSLPARRKKNASPPAGRRVPGLWPDPPGSSSSEDRPATALPHAGAGTARGNLFRSPGLAYNLARRFGSRATAIT